MNLRKILALGALTMAMSHPAQAATYVAEGAGSAIVLNYSRPAFCLGKFCDPEYYGKWNAHLTVEVAGSSDGIYDGSDVLGMTFSSNYGSFEFPGPSLGTQTQPVVTISGGKISGVEYENYNVPNEGFFFSGMNVGAYGNCPGASGCNAWLDYGQYSAGGTLTAVPEPAPIVLTALGLMMVAIRRSQGIKLRSY